MARAKTFDMKTGQPYAGNIGTPPGGGSDPPMELTERVAHLEKNLSDMKADVAVIRSNYATKEDLHKEISTQTWRLVTFVCGFGTALVGATYFLAKHI